MRGFSFYEILHGIDLIVGVACRMYDRTVRPIPEPTTIGLQYKIETLLGITGHKMSKYRESWASAVWAPFKVVWRPHLLMILIFEVKWFILSGMRCELYY